MCSRREEFGSVLGSGVTLILVEVENDDLWGESARSSVLDSRLQLSGDVPALLEALFFDAVGQASRLSFVKSRGPLFRVNTRLGFFKLGRPRFWLVFYGPEDRSASYLSQGE